MAAATQPVGSGMMLMPGVELWEGELSVRTVVKVAETKRLTQTDVAVLTTRDPFSRFTSVCFCDAALDWDRLASWRLQELSELSRGK